MSLQENTLKAIHMKVHIPAFCLTYGNHLLQVRPKSIFILPLAISLLLKNVDKIICVGRKPAVSKMSRAKRSLSIIFKSIRRVQKTSSSPSMVEFLMQSFSWGEKTIISDFRAASVSCNNSKHCLVFSVLGKLQHMPMTLNEPWSGIYLGPARVRSVQHVKLGI